MKHPTRALLAIAITFITALAATTFGAHAKEEVYIDPYDNYDEFIFMDLSLEQNIATPIITGRDHKPVQEYIGKLKDRLKSVYPLLDLTRSGEVLIVSIPCDELFNPCDTLLTPYGVSRLKPLLPYMQDPDMYKILVTINTDDSGSQAYLERLSDARNNTIYGWLLEENRIPDDLIVIPYSMGPDNFITTNDSRANRSLNRRVEIYFVPGPKMIDLAHQGKLK